jgi:hypothetical protein
MPERHFGSLIAPVGAAKRRQEWDGIPILRFFEITSTLGV